MRVHPDEDRFRWIQQVLGRRDGCGQRVMGSGWGHRSGGWTTATEEVAQQERRLFEDHISCQAGELWLDSGPQANEGPLQLLWPGGFGQVGAERSLEILMHEFYKTIGLGVISRCSVGLHPKGISQTEPESWSELGPWSDMMCSGTPYHETQWRMRTSISAVSSCHGKHGHNFGPTGAHVNDGE